MSDEMGRRQFLERAGLSLAALPGLRVLVGCATGQAPPTPDPRAVRRLYHRILDGKGIYEYFQPAARLAEAMHDTGKSSLGGSIDPTLEQDPELDIPETFFKLGHDELGGYQVKCFPLWREQPATSPLRLEVRIHQGGVGESKLITTFDYTAYPSTTNHAGKAKLHDFKSDKSDHFQNREKGWSFNNHEYIGGIEPPHEPDQVAIWTVPGPGPYGVSEHRQVLRRDFLPPLGELLAEMYIDAIIQDQLMR